MSEKKHPILSMTIILMVLFCVSSTFCQELALQKPKAYRGDEKIANWFMSEKLDGIRGFWDGKKLYTRKGVIINPPPWFVRDYPPFELDGELWSDRKSFEFIQSTVMKKKPSGDWEKITFNIFEVPNAGGDFPSRLQKAKDWFAGHNNTTARIIPQIICKDKEHLMAFLNKIESQGGEGVIIKDPKVNYHGGRSPHVLKVKNFDDMEGVVMAINKGKGKFESVMGSLTVMLENRIVFNLGSGFSNNIRKNPPGIGSVVTFKYYGFTKNGKPRFPSFLRVRKD
jgi:DNA ligase-1